MNKISPELNPDELVWNNVKSKVGRSSIKGPDDFQEKVRYYREFPVNLLGMTKIDKVTSVSEYLNYRRTPDVTKSTVHTGRSPKAI